MHALYECWIPLSPSLFSHSNFQTATFNLDTFAQRKNHFIFTFMHVPLEECVRVCVYERKTERASVLPDKDKDGFLGECFEEIFPFSFRYLFSLIRYFAYALVLFALVLKHSSKQSKQVSERASKQEANDGNCVQIKYFGLGWVIFDGIGSTFQVSYA